MLTIIYVLVDDWYQTAGKKLLKGKVGSKPVFTDSEVMTLMLAQDYIPYFNEPSTSPICGSTTWHCSPSWWIRASSTDGHAACGCWWTDGHLTSKLMAPPSGRKVWWVAF